MIVRTDAVVLRSMSYRETSRIVTLFTRAKGKVAVLAKGARLPKSRFGSTVQPMAYMQAVFYYKSTRGLQTLSESAHVQVFNRIGQDLGKLALGLRMVELVQALMQEEEQNTRVFELLVHTLQQLDAAEARAENLLPFFQMRLAEALGFAADIERDVVAGLPEEGGVLDLERGAVLPAAVAVPAAMRASRAALRAYAICARAEADVVLRMQLEPALYRMLEDLVEQFLRYHVEEAYPSRSSQVISQMAAGPG